MESKTLQFDKALDNYFGSLELDENGGQWRSCRFSGEKFYIRPEDIKFYKKVKVPLPTLSPGERARRKLASFNSYNLFKGISALSGNSIIMEHLPNTPFKIYEHQIYYGEGWDPLDYAVEYEPGKSFFEQFRELQLKVPRPNLRVDGTNISSDYTNSAFKLKNCYLVFDSKGAEDSAYCITIDDSKNCFDCFTIFNSNICYNCLQSFRLYKCFFIEYCSNCLNSSFLFDCRDCENCFMSANLRHKKYYFFNQQLSKEEYEIKLKNINLGDREILNKLKEKFIKLKLEAVYKENHNSRAIDCQGDYIDNSKNCYLCTFAMGCENLAYSLGSFKVKDSYDAFGGLDSSLAYDSQAGIFCSGLKFSYHIKSSSDLEYCELCINCHNCFGCNGLRNKSFCIFNKQYTEKEYWLKVDEIKTEMLKSKEYGEFFPPNLMPIPYNISAATSYKGYDNIETAKNYGYRIEEIPEIEQEAEGEILEAQNVPGNIKNVEDDVLNRVISDVKNNKKFRYTKPELEFHRKYNLALSQEHPSIRLENKRKSFGSLVLEFHKRNCTKCQKEIESIYPPEKPKNVYCEDCYLREIV